MEKILIIEDDVWISQSLKLYLENSQFEVFLFHSWEWAVEYYKSLNPDLLILDINLPVKNGIDICREIREFSQSPIVMLTARSNETDKIEWFEIWADDYIAKPFSPRELLVRIQSILRRSKRIENDEDKKWTLTFQKLEIDTNKVIVKYDKKEKTLTKNEFDILRKIVEEDGKLVLRETLMKETIGYSDYLFDRTIDTHIKNIRKKLWNKDIILTIRWEGYRLNK